MIRRKIFKVSGVGDEGGKGETCSVQKDKSENHRILFRNRASKKQCSSIFEEPKENRLNRQEFEQTSGDSDGQAAWNAAVHGVAKHWTRLSGSVTELYISSEIHFKN